MMSFTEALPNPMQTATFIVKSALNETYKSGYLM